MLGFLKWVLGHWQVLQQNSSPNCFWGADYLRSLDIPMVVVSHDREFLDQLCTKIVETEWGKTATYTGNYTKYVAEKEERLMAQWTAYEKQQKEIARQVCLPCIDVLLGILVAA